MSLSNPTLINPAVRSFEWGGRDGVLTYYDRQTRETHEQPLPFRFIVLDQLNTIGGYSKRDQSRIWANEVRNLKEDVLYTRTKNGPIEAAIYSELKETTKRHGSFCKSIYIAFELNGNWAIGNFKAVGASLGPWFDFTKAYSVEQGMVVMTRGDFTDGDIAFYKPNYEWQKWEDGAYQVAVQLDRQLQAFLSASLSAPKVDEDGQGTEAGNAAPGYATPEQRADYETRRAAAANNGYEDPLPTPGNEDKIIEDIGDEPINLDDIPF
jgi:hypothetical protein